MNSGTRSIWTGLGLLAFSAWVRKQAFLRAIYRHMPQRWRDSVSSILAARARFHTRFPRTQAWDAALPFVMHSPASTGKTESSEISVNILGYMRGQFGLAESARLYARALIDAGAQVRLYDIDLNLPHGWEDRSLEAWIGEDMPHGISIIFVNPDYLQLALDKIGRARLKGHYLIACWFWELEHVPGTWLPVIDQVDEIMVASEFIERAFRRVTDKPILRVPQPLGEIKDSGLQRADFGLEDGKFMFLVTFDFNSWVARKNPYAALDAFRLAFPPEREDVRLLIKSSNGFRHPEKFRELLNIAAADARILVRDQVMDRSHLSALQRCADAYVSLHRAEGLGLGLAECMAMGKPVIATAWSGNMDFMDENNSCLVGYRMVPVNEGEYPDSKGAFWAEADTEGAASYMRRLVDEPGFASAIGERAVRSIGRSNSSIRAGELLSRRLHALSSSQQERGQEKMDGVA